MAVVVINNKRTPERESDWLQVSLIAELRELLACWPCSS